jgi:hypothetical protein
MDKDVRLIRSPISVVGMVVTTISAVVFLVVFLADLFGFHTNPYIGILFFIVLPALFLAGLVLIPLGAWIERRRRKAGKAPRTLNWPRLDLNEPSQRRWAVGVFTLTMANVVIVSLAAYRGVEYMDSVQFCGQVCHGVMKPEFVAYQDGPHSRVACVRCHIGPGASSFARAKVSGLRQVLAVARGNYTRPIEAPVQDMRPAREVCEQCHWSEKFHGDKIRRISEYADDEKNTESVTTLQVHVGGGNSTRGTATGIHWHMNIANEIEYITTDSKRQTIPYVRMKDPQGNVREYFAEGVTPEQLATGERRRMDCIDCHNRPSHVIAPTAERAVDEAISRGEIPAGLPFVRREAVKAVKAEYPSQEAASSGIASALSEFYRTQHSTVYASSRQDVDKAVSAATNVYRRSVFPEMNVGFGTYLNNIGHIDSPGCFRCHDDTHKTKEGKAIGQECDTCHGIE